MSTPEAPKPETPVLKLDDTPLKEMSHGDTFACRHGSVAQLLGLTHLGARLHRVPAGKKAWPYHCHLENDELIILLEGEATVRFGAQTYEAKAGDVVGFPASGPEDAHQLINRGEGDLVYLCVSSMRQPEVFIYPDSDKFGVMAGKAALAPGASSFLFFGRRDGGEAGYWDGEE